MFFDLQSHNLSSVFKKITTSSSTIHTIHAVSEDSPFRASGNNSSGSVESTKINNKKFSTKMNAVESFISFKKRYIEKL